MKKISVSKFLGNSSRYIEKVKLGEKIVLMEKNKPIVDIVSYKSIGWKRKIKRIKIKGEKISDTVINNR